MGVHPNTSFPVVHSKLEAVRPYFVERKNTENWSSSECFDTYEEAHAFIVQKMEQYPHIPWRICIYRRKP